MLVASPSMKQVNKEQGNVKRLPVSKGQQVKTVMSVPTQSNSQENKEFCATNCPG